MVWYLNRTREGKIFYTKFDDIYDWVKENTVSTIYGWQWSDSNLCAQWYYSSPYSVTCTWISAAEAETVPAGRYVGLQRTITIFYGCQTVRLQVRARMNLGAEPMSVYSYVMLGDVSVQVGAVNVWAFKNVNVATPGSPYKVLRVRAQSLDEVPGYAGNTQFHLFDELVIAADSVIKVFGLLSGYKAKLYDPSDNLIVEGVESGGVATLDVSTNPYPIAGRLKIYNAANIFQIGTDLREDFFGGDYWSLTEVGSKFTAKVDKYIINRVGGTPPTSATVTFTLRDANNVPIGGKTLYFSTTHGTVNPASAVTNSNGEASTVVSATTLGLAVVKGLFPGEAGFPRNYTSAEISIHHDDDTPDSAKDFDVWVQGKQVVGKISEIDYVVSPSEQKTSVTVTEIPDFVQDLFDFTIYRKGVLIFRGRIEFVRRSIPEYLTTFEGRNLVQALSQVYVEHVVFANQSVKSIIESLFDTYIDPTKQLTLLPVSEELGNIIINMEERQKSVREILEKAADQAGCIIKIHDDDLEVYKT